MGRNPSPVCKQCKQKVDKVNTKGVCKKCQRKSYMKQGTCVACGRERPIRCKGRCDYCYKKYRNGDRTEFKTPVTYANPSREEIVEEPVMQPEPPKAEPKPEPTHASSGELSPPSSDYVRNIPFTPVDKEDVQGAMYEKDGCYLNENDEPMNIADFIGAITRYYHLQQMALLYYSLGILFIMFTAWLCVTLTPYFLMASTLTVLAVYLGIKARREALSIAYSLGMAEETPKEHVHILKTVHTEEMLKEKKPFLGGLFASKPKKEKEGDW